MANDLKPFYQGDTKSIGCAFRELNGQGEAVPRDITGCIMTFMMKADMADPDEEAIINSSITFPENSESLNGIGTLVLTSEQTDVLPGQYFYGLRFIAPGTPPWVKTIKSGKIIVMASVTRGAP
ncbi:MAG: hypothetical protein HQM06_13975 [Magnetococcales bacterium]|nr:hypothetical protein [Magnetococcales bacterium]